MNNMSIKEFLQTYLVENGLFPDQAKQVVTMTENAEENAAMVGRWDDPVVEYPAPLRAVVIMCARRQAVKWIEDNMPLHWAKPMFEGSAE